MSESGYSPYDEFLKAQMESESPALGSEEGDADSQVRATLNRSQLTTDNTEDLHVTRFRPLNVGGSDSLSQFLRRDASGHVTTIEVKEIDLEEPEFIGLGGKQHTSRLLRTLVKAQEKVFNFLGKGEVSRKAKTYANIRRDYVSLCQKVGLESDSFIAMTNPRNRDWDGTKILNIERSIQTILTDPIVHLEASFGRDKKNFNKMLDKQLGINRKTRQEVLKKIFTMPGEKLDDFINTLDTNEGFIIKSEKDIELTKEYLKKSILRARLMSLSLYGKFHWREFVKTLMHENSNDRAKIASRFNTGAAFITDKSFIEMRDILADELKHAAVYDFAQRRLGKKDSDGLQEVIERTTTAVVPFGFTFAEDGEIELTYPPKIRMHSTNEDRPEGWVQTLGDEGNVTMEINFNQKSKNSIAPGSYLAYSNRQEVLDMKDTLSLKKVPLVVNIDRYANGETYVSLISDHSIADGKPNAEMLARVLGAFGVTEEDVLPLVGETSIRQLDEYVKGLEINEFTEVNSALPLDPLKKFRTLLKEAKANEIPIVDEIGNDVDISYFGLGTLLTGLYGNIIRKQAVKNEIVTSHKDKLGGLASVDDISEQLMQVNVSDLQLDTNLNTWLQFDGDKLVLNQDLVDKVTTLKTTFQEIGSDRDATDVVRGVYNLPNIMWQINSWLSTSLLKRFSSKTVGRVMLSSIKTEKSVMGGPALVEKWQDLAVTVNRIEGDWIGIALKMRGDSEKVGSFLEGLHTQLFNLKDEAENTFGKILKQIQEQKDPEFYKV